MQQLEILDHKYDVLLQIVDGEQRQYTLNVTTESLRLIDITTNAIEKQWKYNEFQVDWQTTSMVERSQIDNAIIQTQFNCNEIQAQDDQMHQLKESLNGRCVYLNVFNYYSSGIEIGNQSKLCTQLSTGAQYILNFIPLRSYQHYQSIMNVLGTLRNIPNQNQYFQYAQELYYEQNQLIEVQMYHQNSGDLSKFIKNNNYCVSLSKSIEIMKLILLRLHLLHNEAYTLRIDQTIQVSGSQISLLEQQILNLMTLWEHQGQLNEKSQLQSSTQTTILLTQENIYPQDSSIVSKNLLNKYQISPKIENIPFALDLLQAMLASVENRMSAQQCLNHQFFAQWFDYVIN